MTNSRSALWALAVAAAVGLIAAPAFAAFHLGGAPKPKKEKAAAAAQPAASADDWRELDPQNVLVIDTTKGRIFVEMDPQAAPQFVERVKLLTRQRFYDGLKWHRVIDGFMAQTGDPLGTGEGQSTYPNVKAEFTFRRDANVPYVPIAAPSGTVVGFLGDLPIATQPDAAMDITADHKVWAWGLFCPGVAGAARGNEDDSANSQFFLMRDSYPSLEKRYTAWGRVVAGEDVVKNLKTGEPVVDPDVMTKVQVLADMPEAGRPRVLVLSATSKPFQAIVDRVRKERGADFSICDVDIPSQVR
ncbi:MAG TPA: peptidylprolyl isomerase [Caulobacteraceae bacterium]|jgi:peptidylprolyl isomerase|nr:peptidylprolyl isomerase [Caulobacteraceae bacterium]